MLERAARAGVARVLVPGWDLASSRAAVALCRRRAANDRVAGIHIPPTPHLVAAAGIHPHAAAEVDGPVWRALTVLADDPAVVAIGETGLDYDRMLSQRESQLVNLRRHLGLALSTGKPLVLHCRSARGRRDAQDELLGELGDAGFGGTASETAFGVRPPAVLHSFSGPLDYAEQALAMGLAVSFSGLVFREGEEASAEVARLVPRDRFLVETDAPYLPPPGAPRRRNEPEWVRVTAAWFAEQRGEGPASLERESAATFERIFGALRPE